jgi:parvulin-like peptidyl-prolyl isomerase
MIQAKEYQQEDLDNKINPATDLEIIKYLRRSHRFAEIAESVEKEAIVLETCDRMGIEVSDEEWQAAGNNFRLKNKLLGTIETQNWFAQQRISLDDWSQGIKNQVFAQKLKEHLFGAAVDGSYISNRDRFRQVALSQIIVKDPTEAMTIAKTLREGEISFCILAIEHSRTKQARNNGGFLGVCFLSELMKDVANAIAEAKEGEIIGPIQTKVGYHILKVEKWYKLQLTPQLREQLLESLFQGWLKEQMNPED